jgi:dTDP-4-dehydrorhamnose reductase
MRFLVTGSNGQLGRALARVVSRQGHEFIGVDLPEVDITDAGAVERLTQSVRPTAIINCAAFTAVDRAETEEPAALAVNGTAVGHLAEAANRIGAVLVQVSTDYVFDGTSRRPWREDDPTNPVSAYGRTKLAGEQATVAAREHLIARTAWLYGEGHNFVEAIRKQLLGGNRSLKVVDDQHGCPTLALDLADALLRLLDRGGRGTFHVVNDGVTTWWGFAREIVEQLGYDAQVLPITTAEAGRPALRPAYSVLDTGRLSGLLGAGLPRWQDALRRYLAGD